MAIQKTDRDQILDSALHLFRTQGYHNTSVSDISASCGLLKGSLYHYFPSKQGLAESALEKYILESWDRFFWIAYQDEKAPELRMEEFCHTVAEYFGNRRGGCLMANIALEVGDNIPEFIEIVRRYFADWIEAVAEMLSARYAPDRATQIAAASLARIQGALMLNQVESEMAHFEGALAELRGFLDN
ncbi:MAG: TetR/AcrR family transcriptional regulator [Proteobacteria bacterium]|nr:TetR/AcrR family transcriptional regulator [Pseudomonadota bacterium]